jgi:putative ABC transport system permease protein
VQVEVSRLSGIPVAMKSLVVPLQEQMVGSARRGLLTLAAAVASVLLLLGVNLAGLLLARASDREREAALRTALGASRGRVLRQLVIENLLLAVAGGGLGVALAGGLLSVLATRLPVDLPRFDEVHLSAIGIGIALLLTLLTGVLFSLVPALRLSAAPPREALAAGGRALGAGKGTARLRGALVSGQVALSTVLLIVAGLLVASFVRLISVPRGFDTEHVVLATVVPAPDRHADDAKRVAFFDALLEEVRALPGLETTALVSYAPLKGEAHVHTLTREHDTRLVTLRPAGNIRYVSPDYFQALGIRLTRGRALTDADRGRLVIVINERTAHVLWPGQDPIGKRLHQGMKPSRCSRSWAPWPIPGRWRCSASPCSWATCRTSGGACRRAPPWSCARRSTRRRWRSRFGRRSGAWTPRCRHRTSAASARWPPTRSRPSASRWS